MRHFKSASDEIFAIKSDGSQDYLILDEWSEISEDELDEMLTPAPLTSEQQILELEGTITPRNLRSAVLGDSFAIAKIQDIETQIAVLRG